MDISTAFEDICNIEETGHPMSRIIPTYDLYGEIKDRQPDFRLHCETIASRSSTYHWEIAQHRHERLLQFLYIASGSGDAILDGVSHPLAPPAVVYVPPGAGHGFRFSRDIDGLVITVAAEPAPSPTSTLMIGRYARVIAVDPAGPDAAYLAETFRRIEEEYDAARPGRAALLDAHLATVAILLRRTPSLDDHETEPDGPHRHVAALRELIGRHFRQQMTAADYARRLGLSPTHLNRVVRQVTGETTHDLIIGRSIEEAKRALLMTGASIRHISDSLGFSDAAYFSRCFRQRTGKTPRQYRSMERLERLVSD